MPNVFAHVVLFSWPLVVVVLFSRLPVGPAIAWSIIGGYLLLPEQLYFNLPLVPAFNKATIPALTAFALCLQVARSQRRRDRSGARTEGSWLPASRLGLALFAVYMLHPIATVLTNGDGFGIGDMGFPGLSMYDAGNLMMSNTVGILGFLMARRFLADEDGQAALVRALAAAAFVYAVPTLLEIRFSPQFSNAIYGFFPHSWLQHLRDGAFRPVVFLNHALWLALFLTMGTVAMATLSRTAAPGRRLRPALATLFLAVVVALSNSFGALIILLVVLPVALLPGTRLKMMLVAAVATAAIAYPVLRAAHLVPTQALIERIAAFDENRAGSLRFRIGNEELLLDRALLRPAFGWGGYGRGDVFDEITGERLSVVDSSWIITINRFGWLGFTATFGLLVMPLMMLWRRSAAVGLSTAGLCLALAANLVDLMPNATITPITWLIAGALLGRAEQLAALPAPRRPDRASRGALSGTAGAAGPASVEPPPAGRRGPLLNGIERRRP